MGSFYTKTYSDRNETIQPSAVKGSPHQSRKLVKLESSIFRLRPGLLPSWFMPLHCPIFLHAVSPSFVFWIAACWRVVLVRCSWGTGVRYISRIKAVTHLTRYGNRKCLEKEPVCPSQQRLTVSYMEQVPEDRSKKTEEWRSVETMISARGFRDFSRAINRTDSATAV